MFATDLSNHIPTNLYPTVTGVHAKSTNTLDTAVKTITQIDGHTFNKAFNRQGRYPTNQHVSWYEIVCGTPADDVVL